MIITPTAEYCTYKLNSYLTVRLHLYMRRRLEQEYNTKINMFRYKMKEIRTKYA